MKCAACGSDSPDGKRFRGDCGAVLEAGREDAVVTASPAEARDLLAPLYGWFTAGFDTPDLIAAKALLEELGGSV